MLTKLTHGFRLPLALIVYGYNPAVWAQAAVDIGSAGTGPLAGVVAFLQEIVDFMSGPFALFVLAGGLVSAICLWMWAPRENGAMSGMFRALFAGVLILNIGGIIAWAAGMAT